MFTIDLPWKAIGYGVAILMIVGLFSYAGCQATKAARYEMALNEQIEETRACNETAGALMESLERQSKAAHKARVAAEGAEALYHELLNRPPEIRIVPRERIVEVIRPGDCDRAALDAWDMLHGGNASWGINGPSATDWYNFYASAPSSGWGLDAAPPLSVLPNSLAVSEFQLYVSPSGFPSHSPQWSGQGTLISGRIVSPARR